MIIEQLMPAKSPTMTEGTLVSWQVKPGDQVAHALRAGPDDSG